MTKKRTGDPWMPAPQFSAGLRGLGVNLLVRDIDRSLVFHRRVLDASVLYSDPDIAVLTRDDAQWILHAWHTYDDHPLHERIVSRPSHAVGAELRLYGRDPDDAERVARELGCEIAQASADKAHGLRECFIFDFDGYLWVPGVAMAA